MKHNDQYQNAEFGAYLARNGSLNYKFKVVLFLIFMDCSLGLVHIEINVVHMNAMF